MTDEEKVEYPINRNMGCIEMDNILLPDKIKLD